MVLCNAKNICHILIEYPFEIENPPIFSTSKVFDSPLGSKIIFQSNTFYIFYSTEHKNLSPNVAEILYYYIRHDVHRVKGISVYFVNKQYFAIEKVCMRDVVNLQTKCPTLNINIQSKSCHSYTVYQVLYMYLYNLL